MTAEYPTPSATARGAGRGLGAFGPPLLLLAVMWGLELIDAVLRGTLDDAGIAARDVDGLMGILAAPFLHGVSATCWPTRCRCSCWARWSPCTDARPSGG